MILRGDFIVLPGYVTALRHWIHPQKDFHILFWQPASERTT